MSGRKNALIPYHLISAGDLSDDLTSDIVIIQYLDNIALQLNCVGTAVGTFAVEVSLDYNQSTKNPGTWVAVSLPEVPAVAGADKNIFIDLNQLAASALRVTYTSTSGTGTVNAYIAGKMV
jgi:hypothetical protein